MELTLQPVRSQDSSEVADGHDGCHDTEKGQGRERADQCGEGLGGQGEESQDGARHRHGSAHQGGIVDRDVASRLAGLHVPVVGWEVHVRRDAGPDRLHGDQQGLHEQACSDRGGQVGGGDVQRGGVPP